MNNKFTMKLTAGVAAVVMCAGIFPQQENINVETMSTVLVSAADTTDYLIRNTVSLLGQNEGTYNSVNMNDCGAVSIGKIQWHGTRALNLLKTIVKANPVQAKNILGDTLYKEIKEKSDWSKRIVNNSEKNLIVKLLSTQEAKKAEDNLAYNDVKNYVKRAQSLGITSDAAIVYYADLYNFGPVCADRVAKNAASTAGSYRKITLDNLHDYALSDKSSGMYKPRRKRAYDFCRKLEPKVTSSPSAAQSVSPSLSGSVYAGIYFRPCDSKYGSIVDALNSIGVKSSMTYRKEIARVNNIKNYSGTADENIYMLELLKTGRLIAPERSVTVTTQVSVPVTTPYVSSIVTEAVTTFETEITEPVTETFTEAVSTFSNTETSVTTSEPEVFHIVTGDINNDENIDISDLSLLSTYLVGDRILSETEKLAADINKDGIVSLSDLATLKQFLSKTIAEI